MVTSHAVEVPMTMVPTPTPSISQSVLPTYTHSTVETRWPQMPSEGPSAVKRTEPTGMATSIDRGGDQRPAVEREIPPRGTGERRPPRP